MIRTFAGIVLILTIGLFSSIPAQMRERKMTPGAGNTARNCRVFLNGQILKNPKPVYPDEAKTAGISGKVEVVVEIDTFGNVTAIESTSGPEILAKAAASAAGRAVFSPTMCDGKAAKTIGVITYNFAPVELIREFYKPGRIEDLPDISSEDNHYEAIIFLTENYRIAFGYADRKFHAEMPLTYGDFVHFLRQTLEMLDSRGKLAGKIPSEIGLYHPFNPHKLKEIEINPTAPYAGSLKILSQKYRIVIADPNGNFDGDALPTKREIIEIWRGIFDEDALPVNFLPIRDEPTEISRGEFAIYLKESLDVLTYRILP